MRPVDALLLAADVLLSAPLGSAPLVAGDGDPLAARAPFSSRLANAVFVAGSLA